MSTSVDDLEGIILRFDDPNAPEKLMEITSSIVIRVRKNDEVLIQEFDGISYAYWMTSEYIQDPTVLLSIPMEHLMRWASALAHIKADINEIRQAVPLFNQ